MGRTQPYEQERIKPYQGERIKELKYDDDTQTAFWNLPDEETIILFTPYLPVPPNHVAAAAGSGRDPFEGLGRGIARLHPEGKLHHVPYVPPVGFSDNHYKYVDESATIVIVIVEPHGLSAEDSRMYLHAQQKFAKDTMKNYHVIHEGTEPDAVILVYCGRQRYMPPASISTAIQIRDYTGEDWAGVAAYLIKGEMS